MTSLQQRLSNWAELPILSKERISSTHKSLKSFRAFGR